MAIRRRIHLRGLLGALALKPDPIASNQKRREKGG